MDAQAERMVALASEKLAGRLDVSVDEITLVRVQPVEWRDASLGCPKPGVDYIQVLTPGYVIKLEAGGVRVRVPHRRRPARRHVRGEEIETPRATRTWHGVLQGCC